MKILINACYGGFGLSEAAMREYGQRAGMKLVRTAPRYEKDEGYPYLTANPNLPDVVDWDDLKTTLHISSSDFDRNDPVLIAVVEELGAEVSSGPYAKLKIVEIPDGVGWEIDEYDGFESIEEAHRSWS